MVGRLSKLVFQFQKEGKENGAKDLKIQKSKFSKIGEAIKVINFVMTYRFLSENVGE